jgi:hypothetical protein
MIYCRKCDVAKNTQITEEIYKEILSEAGNNECLARGFLVV